MPQKTFTDEQAEKLIELVREQRAIYDTKHEDYRDTNVRANIWQSIAKEMGQYGGK